MSKKRIFEMEPVDKASTIERSILSSSGNVTAPVVVRRERDSTTWCLTPAFLTTSKSNSDNRSRHSARQPILLDRLRIHLNKSWFVRMVSSVSSR